MGDRKPRAATKVRQLLAAEGGEELAARWLALLTPPAGEPVHNASIAYRHFAPMLLGLDHERLAVLGLDRRHRVVASAVLTTGSSALTVVDPRQVFRWALTQYRPVDAILLAHNHPSGDPTPSPQDRDVTDAVARAGKAIGIALLDHLVIGGVDNYVSIGSPWRVSALGSNTGP